MGSLKYYFDKIGYANNTTCIQSTDLELIQQNIITMFEDENYRLISQPPLPQNSDFLIQELLSSSYKTNPYLWIVGLSVGKSGWTTIKTSIEDLLCHKTKSNERIWLSQLATQTDCDSFHHNLQNRHWGVLLETNSLGQTLATGFLEEVDDLNNIKFYGVPVAEPEDKGNFYLIDVPEAFQTAGKTKINLGKREKQTKNEELERVFQQGDEKQREKAIAEWKELNMGGRERFDSDLGNLICRSNFFWHEDNLFHKAYAKPKQLEQNEVQLLFFQVGRFDLDPSKEEIWLPIENFNWVNYFADLKKINLGKK